MRTSFCMETDFLVHPKSGKHFWYGKVEVFWQCLFSLTNYPSPPRKGFHRSLEGWYVIRFPSLGGWYSFIFSFRVGHWRNFFLLAWHSHPRWSHWMNGMNNCGAYLVPRFLNCWASNAMICLLSFEDVPKIRDNKAMQIKRVVWIFFLFFIFING